LLSHNDAVIIGQSKVGYVVVFLTLIKTSTVLI